MKNLDVYVGWFVGLVVVVLAGIIMYTLQKITLDGITPQPLQCIDQLVYKYDAKNQMWVGTGQTCVSRTKPIKRPAAVNI